MVAYLVPATALISDLYGINKYSLINMSVSNVKNIMSNSMYNQVCDEDKITAGLVRDLMALRDNNCTEFSHSELNCMLEYLCTC